MMRTIWHRLARQDTAGFVLCGIVLELTFVVLLAAANDIVDGSKVTTSAVLAASIFPLWLLKLVAPLCLQEVSYFARVFISTMTACWALAATALISNVGLKLLFGVSVGAISTGLAEFTFFAMAARYHNDCLISLSTGSGLSGIVGAGFYFFLSQILHFSPRATLLISAVIPVSMIAFFLLFIHPLPDRNGSVPNALGADEDGVASAATTLLLEAAYEEGQVCVDVKNDSASPFPPGSSSAVVDADPRAKEVVYVSVATKLNFIHDNLLRQYMLPLFSIFFTGYLINQGIVPTIHFNSAWVSPHAQYTLFFFASNVGGVLARMSSMVMDFNCVYLMASLQAVVLVILVLHIWHEILPNFGAMLLLAVFGGVVGGLTFVNTLRLLNTQTEKGYWREFAMGAVSIADASGVALASIVGMAFEGWIRANRGITT